MQNYDPYDLVVACESKWSTIVLEIVGHDAHSFKQAATMACLFEKCYILNDTFENTKINSLRFKAFDECNNNI